MCWMLGPSRWISIACVALLGISASSVALSQAETKIRIDIKPGDEPTTINPFRDGMLPVAIISTADFEAMSIDPDTVRFINSEAAPVRSMQDDVNADDRPDLVLLFRNREIGITCGDEKATLTARTRDGTTVTGSEAIRVVGCDGG